MLTGNPRYVFRNVRFAAPPVGNLRWAKPAPPQPNSTLHDGSYGPKCVQSAVSGLNLVGPGNTSPVGAAINQFLGGIPVPLFQGGDEDCLFLDLYVPGKALKNPGLKLKKNDLEMIHDGRLHGLPHSSIRMLLISYGTFLSMLLPLPCR